MTQEESLLLKDLCGRIPYGVKALYYDPEAERETYDEVEGIFNDGQVDIGQYGLDVWKIKPYLFPLSSMTEEQKEELKKDTCPNGTGYFNEHSLCCPMNHFGEQIPFEFMSKIIEWFNKNHYDYRGLIGKHLANDATGLGIYKEGQP